MKMEFIADRVARKLIQTARWLDSRTNKLFEQRVSQDAAGTYVLPTPEHLERPEYSNLSRHFGRKLIIADVGCRWGFADTWSKLSPYVSLYGFDPDAKECDRLRPLYKDSDVTLVPEALADTASRRTLYLTKEPGCSSLYKPDSRLTTTMPELACAREVGTTEMTVTTLDQWASTAGMKTVDFLKLDTQGAELDILRGGTKVLQTVRALEIEVEFNPIYLGQPLFGDVDRFVRERGFVLWRLSSLAHYSRGKPRPERQEENITYYDSVPVTSAVFGGQLYWGHAYYVRSEIAAGETGGDWSQAIRDATLMFALGFIDLGYNLLDAVEVGGGPTGLIRRGKQIIR